MTIQADLQEKFQFLRVNAFRGLLIDENTWADAHEYHRTMMQFHLLALHGSGVAQGLEVTAMQPPEMRVTVQPGVAVDPYGRLLSLPHAKSVEVPVLDNFATVFVFAEFVERASQVQSVTDGGTPQPARMLEECTIKCGVEIPPHGLELARVTLEPRNKQVRDAANPRQPGAGEIDMTNRLEIGHGGGGGGRGGAREHLTVGILRHGPPDNQDWKRHSGAVRRLVSDLDRLTSLDVNLLEGISLMDENGLRNCKLLYATGRAALRLSPEEEQGLRRFLDRGGILWCEPCRNGLPNGTPDDFSRSCMELTQKLNRQPTQPKSGHWLLSSQYLFAAPPPALDPAGVVVEANRMIIATGDYGCLWEGKGQERAAPPPRQMLRDAQEIGANLMYYAATFQLAGSQAAPGQRG